jgi:hypothetical protein
MVSENQTESLLFLFNWFLVLIRKLKITSKLGKQDGMFKDEVMQNVI